MMPLARRLYFLRHGLADPDRYDGPDELRPLVPEGRRRLEITARLLAGLDLGCELIVTSPLVRAAQTAGIVAAGLGLAGRVTVDERLRPGCRPADLARILDDLAPARGNLMVVGHEPDFSLLVGALTGGLVAMKKGALARVDLLDRAERSGGRLRGQLIWLLQPRVFLGLGEPAP
jgi:phosphohistidine phosphatase